MTNKRDMMINATTIPNNGFTRNAKIVIASDTGMTVNNNDIIANIRIKHPAHPSSSPSNIIFF